ncbi:type II toxin-antitoxin system HicA family toxin [Aureimonas leprariae]|uniref:Addiction module toxin, HicA family n=1 Tax=Plantimonas leprariae TaxID=2615207 RepID=A0A7V7PKQ0_9HYPH|nr:type II toxin-antitoxin system HicA family toxin [Aureimonas leprariae]KAB0676545.1 addiction module toxin, HicA family [Aureimonas leprariae]
MPALPNCTGRQARRALERAGFELVRIVGSHHIMRHTGPPSRSVTVPVHRNADLKRATLSSIIKQAGLSVDEFIGLL